MEEKLTQTKNKLKYRNAEYHPYFTYIKNYISFFLFLRIDSVNTALGPLSTVYAHFCCFSIENSLKLLLWHLQGISLTVYTPQTPNLSVQFSTHSTLKPQKEETRRIEWKL